jgi:predicted dehydrogenase
MEKTISLIGYGYWGKILHKNLISMGFTNVTIFDEVLGNMGELNESFDYYFIATPFSTHLDVLDILSKYNNKKIWCEKPLASSYKEVTSIYKKMESRNNKLFIDWVYAHNPAIDYIKNVIGDRKIKQAILNRTNDGPVRTDCSSIWDLSSHDLSILFKIFGYQENFIDWNEFSIKSNEKIGSNISWSYKNGTQIIINSSWQHQTKNRVSVFITEEDDIIVFDDVKKTVTEVRGDDSKLKDFSDEISPLESALTFFFASDNFKKNQKMTEQITLEITGYNEHR